MWPMKDKWKITNFGNVIRKPHFAPRPCRLSICTPTNYIKHFNVKDHNNHFLEHLSLFKIQLKDKQATDYALH